ncbi:MAG: peptide deformylase [Burkholderiales bacterium]|jgi:peptide deformylase|nr:peptide deformylase [Burkholderiales bacterium]
MAQLPILQYPDPRLHIVAAPVTRFDDELQRLVRDMAETMYAAPGVGLSATQVDIHRQVIVIDVSDTRDALQVFINPVLLEGWGESGLEEGCLSVPGVYDQVPRYERVRIEARDVRGERFELEVDGLMSVCVQHEMDHLKGRVFVEYLSRLKQNRIASRMRKQQRRAG